MATKKQSRPIVKGLANPRGVTAVYGTPIDWGSLPEKIRIGRRIANGRFKLEAHYPAKHFNDKKEYIDKRKAGSYCRFYDNKSPFFVARTVWDETSQPGMHMVVKNRNETYRFLLTPKADDPTEATVIGAYLVHREDGVPVLCSGPIGELKAIGDDGDFKVTAYKKHGIRCPKKDSSGKDLAGEIPKTFGYTKRTYKKGPRKTAKDYCKPSHTFTHPTDIKRAEVVEEMDAYMDEQCTCLMCNWSGAYSDLAFFDDTPEGGPPGMDFMLVCPSCGEGDWLDDMMAEGYDEPCFSCDGIGTWDAGDCEYCHGSGMMSDNLRAEMALYNSEYFDADCGCFKKAETLSFMDWAKQEEASHLKKYRAESDQFPSMHYGDYDSDAQEKYQDFIYEWDLDDNPPSFEEWYRGKEYHEAEVCPCGCAMVGCVCSPSCKGECLGAESFEASRGLHKKHSKQIKVGPHKKEGYWVLPKNLSKEDRRQIWMRRRKGSDFHAEDEGPAKDYIFVAFDVTDGEREYSLYTILPKSHADSSGRELIEWMYGSVGEEEREGEYWVDGVILVKVATKEPITTDLKTTLNGLGLYAESLSNGDEVIQSMAAHEVICITCDRGFPPQNGIRRAQGWECLACSKGESWGADTFEAKYSKEDGVAQTDYEKVVVLFDVSGSIGRPDGSGPGQGGWAWFTENLLLNQIQERWEDKYLTDDIDFISFGSRAANVTPPRSVSIGSTSSNAPPTYQGWNVSGSQDGTRPELGLERMEENFEREFGTDRPATLLYILSDGVFNYQSILPFIEKPWLEEVAIVFMESVNRPGYMKKNVTDMEAALKGQGSDVQNKVQVIAISPTLVCQPGGGVKYDMGPNRILFAESFEAPYAGPGATMDISKDTALSSFTPEELTTSSAIHGDFDQASLDYSGHQNIEVRAESSSAEKIEFELMPYKKVKGMGILSGHNAIDSISGNFEWDGYSLQLIVDGEWQDDVLDLPTTHPRRPLGNDQLEFINAMVYDLPHPMNNISWGELGKMGWLWAGSVMQALSHDYSTNADDNDWSDEMPMEMEHGRYDAESFGAERYGKRQRFGNRYVARNTKGEFISNVGVGASLKADRRNKSKTPARSGFGNRGDSQKTPPTWAKPLGYVGALAAGWISASMIDKAKE